MQLLRVLPLSALVLALAAPVAGAGTSGGTPPNGAAVPASGASGGSVPTGGAPTSAPAPVGAPDRAPSSTARAEIPAAYLRLYRAAARARGVDWRILAAIGRNESDHGRSRAPGVRSGLNYARCCAGPMQFCTVRSCGNTWRAYATDGDRDGRASVYDPADAIPAAARLVGALTRQVGARADLVLASYNAGPRYAMQHRRVPPYPETRRYVASALAYIRRL